MLGSRWCYVQPFWLKFPRVPDRRACDRCCDADARAQQKNGNAKEEIEVSCSWETLTW